MALAECAEAAQLPKGVFHLVAGSAKDIAAEFLENPLCRKITFTGSTEVGRSLIQGAAAGIKPLSLELGGHAPVLVFEDADLDRAVEGAMITKFRNTGQSCIASNRIYVQRSVYAKFVEKFAEQTRALKTGDGLEEGVMVGPLINEEGLTKAPRTHRRCHATRRTPVVRWKADRGQRVVSGTHRPRRRPRRRGLHVGRNFRARRAGLRVRYRGRGCSIGQCVAVWTERVRIYERSRSRFSPDGIVGSRHNRIERRRSVHQPDVLSAA